MVRIRRALVSVSDKRGLQRLAATLLRHGIEILSTGGTARLLREAGATVTDVAAHTGAKEILDGRVKTLHPRIHGGLLGRDTVAHRAEMAANDIPPIDLVVVNLYPFAATIARADATLGEAIENIDIGGPSMIRSGAKNHERVAVVVDPADYEAVCVELDGQDGALSAATRFRLARKAFALTAAYDAAIANFLTALPPEAPRECERPQPAPFPEVLTLQWTSGTSLRYGENPHQQAAFYRDPDGSPEGGPSVARAEILQGKELSYNNLVDLDAALALCAEFARPAAVIVKHTNPCGAAESDGGLAVAYARARACDPVSAFGGVVAVNRPVDEALARLLGETFLECIVAPSFTDGARGELGRKKNLRLLACGPVVARSFGRTVRSIHGGLLVQSGDDGTVAAAAAEVITRRRPSDAELCDLDFAWRVAKHVKSNAIVLARDGATVGVGAGQMSRVDSVRIAVDKARGAGHEIRGCVLASDAFFPFRDGLDAAAAAGVGAVIQPGGSVRDDEVIAAADEHGVAMVLTRMRHFKH
ncbi:MAG: bifunctional phosphoribosylaminoimidazolecarboxamide formyltransferase/IMP cyclohydrolase [Myxococcales bacterium]|nr:bifunctional phosphoribosylaminoimidazolecarboxamide formyltransferase/IMP cyclohydrolase [Myxococcales bacterium]